MTEMPTLTADQLIRHEAFVHAVARALLGDDPRARDVVQETWLTALRKSPDRPRSTRSWLGRIARNHALDALRSSQRRAKREVGAARDEAVESVDRSFERLSVQRDVVDAVLDLDEPYRSVILLRFFQGLDTEAAAERLDRSAATARSQQSRALAKLRESFERKYGDDESVWMSALLPLAAAPAASKALGIPSLGMPATVGLLTAVLGCASLLFVLHGRAPEEDLAVASLTANAASTTVGAAQPTAPTAQRIGGNATDRAGVRTPALPDEDSQAAPDEREPVEELREQAAQVQAALEAHLLSPDPDVVAAQSSWTRLPGTGVCRMVDRDYADRELAGALVTRGGGAYYSFANRHHSYDASPDLEYGRGRFSSGFYGRSVGLVAWIGDVALDALPTDAEPVPAATPESQRFAWDALWRPISFEDTAHDSSFREETQELRRAAESTDAPMTYLVRSYLPGEHDLLAAFRILARDEHTVTIGWRVLKTWPAPGEHRPKSWSAPVPPTIPEEYALLTVDELLDGLREIRERAHPLLFDVPTPLRAQYAGLIAADEPRRGSTSGFARILHRWEWNGLTSVREGGAYFSFASGSNSYNDEPDLSLEQDRLEVVQAGRLNTMIDLGAVPFEQHGAVLAGGAPTGLEESERAAWDFLHAVQPDDSLTDQRGRRAMSADDEARARELGITHRGAEAALGHAYLMRTVLSQHADQLVVFVVIGEDVAGYSLAWRVLRTWPIPPKPQRR